MQFVHLTLLTEIQTHIHNEDISLPLYGHDLFTYVVWPTDVLFLAVFDFFLNK